MMIMMTVFSLSGQTDFNLILVSELCYTTFSGLHFYYCLLNF